ncbi:hypothetical protein MJH12_20015 [bacterium]|nr:hypothetical protein [bacterium]
MSFTISNLTSNQAVAGGKLERLRVSHKKLDTKSQTSKTSSPSIKPRVSDTLRFELSTLNQKSVDMQNEISKGFSTNVALSNLSGQIDDLKGKFNQNNKEELSTAIDNTIRQHTFEGKEVLNQEDPNTSSHEAIEAVTVERPPRVGSYSISLFKSPSSTSHEVEFTIEVASKDDFNKSITTKVIPTTGLISGVDIYFDRGAVGQSKDDSLKAEIEVKESKPFSVPNFKDDLEALKSSSSEEDFEDKRSQISSKIKSSQNLIQKDLESTQVQFQSTQNTRENLNAASSASIDLSKAAELVNQTQETLLKSPESTSQLFHPEQTTNVKSLLE